MAKHLDNKNLHNLTNSSPFFRNLLWEQRVQFLFQGVFEVLVPCLFPNISSDSNRENRETENNEVEALILNCRLACRAWNKTLCNLAQERFNWTAERNRFMETENFEMQKKYAVFQFIDPAYNFKDTTQVDKFVQKFQSSTSNPFFGKTIFLTIPVDGSDVDRNCHDKTVYFLQLFGRHLTNCKINVLPETDLEQTYLDLMDVLWAMPNLKILRVESHPYRSISEQPLQNTRMAPKLGNLQRLELQYICRIICNAIIGKNLQVSMLSVHQSKCAKNVDYLRFPYEHLEKLCLKWYDWDEIRYLDDSNIKWNLKSLRLKTYDGKQDHGLTWPELFNTLSKLFGETLEDLELGLPQITQKEHMHRLLDDMLVYRLNFPKLKQIQLRVTHFTPFDFLLGASKSLEDIHISTYELTEKSLDNFFKVQRMEAVKICGCFCKFCRSKLWKSFPKLQSVGYRGKFCGEKYNRNDRSNNFLGINRSEILLTVCCKLRRASRGIRNMLQSKGSNYFYDYIIF